MDRLSTINRPTNPVSKQTADYPDSTEILLLMLEKANQMHPAERFPVLTHILEQKMPADVITSMLNQIVLASYDMQEEEAMKTCGKILARFPEIAEDRSVDEAESELRGLTDAMLTASITRPDEFIKELHSKLIATATAIEHTMYADYLFEELSRPINLQSTKDVVEAIKNLAQLIPRMSGKKQLESTLALYRLLPNKTEQRIQGLEAIMEHTSLVPESHDSFTVLNIINTELFKARLSQL